MMRSSPLRLKELFFPQVSVKALTPATPEKAPRELDLDNLDISFGFDFDTSGNAVNAGVGIITQSSSTEASEQISLYEVHVEVFATFDVVSPEHKDPLAAYLRKVAAASALIGAAREQIALMTSRGPWGVVMLPMISMDRVVGLPPKKAEPQQPEIKKIRTRKKSVESLSAPS
jgi:hypothetical protein